MNYGNFIGSECLVWCRSPKNLDMKRWKEYGYHACLIEGKVVCGTFGIVVIEDEQGLTHRINDELIVCFEEIGREK